jgi:phospholipid/cholesterol/gamma-HCH transport system substrate-binding protein
MPDRSKVRWSQLKVGVVGISAFVILFVLVFLLTSSKGGLFRHNALIRTFLEDASGIVEGSPVRLNGFTVGYLDKIQLASGRDPHRAVEFDMRIEEKYLKDIPVDSVAAISASNLLGDKFINITRGPGQETVREGAELKSLQGQDIPELMAQTGKFLETFQSIVKRLDTLLAGVEAGKGNIGLLLKDDELYVRVNAIASEMQKLLLDVRNSNGTVSKLLHDDTLYQELRAPLKRLDAILADIQSGQGSVGKILKDPALYDDFRKTVAEMNALLADVNAGKGNAGKLLKDEQLYKRVDDLVARFNTIIERTGNGQGTLGQFLVNAELYQSLLGTTKEFQSLAKDMHANPKKFLTIRLTLF